MRQHIPGRSRRTEVRFEKKHPLPGVALREICKHKRVYAAHQLIVNNPLEFLRSHRFSVNAERFGKRKLVSALVSHRRSVTRERLVCSGVHSRRRVNLPPDGIHPRHIHGPQAAHDASVALICRTFRHIFPDKMPARKHAVVLAPLLDRTEVTLHKKIGHHIIVVDAQSGKPIVRIVRTSQHFFHMGKDVIPLLRLEHFREIGSPAH